MPGPLIRDPFTSPAVPGAVRSARDWVDQPTPEGWWSQPQENPGAGVLEQIIKMLIGATGVTDPASQAMAISAPMETPGAELWHGSPKQLGELRPGSMMTSDRSWASGYTTKVGNDLSETFTGKLHRAELPVGPTISATTLHGAEGKVLSMGRQFLGREPRTLQEAADAIAVNTDLVAVVVKNGDAVTDAIALRPARVAATADPVETLRELLANGQRIPSNLQAALDRIGAQQQVVQGLSEPRMRASH